MSEEQTSLFPTIAVQPKPKWLGELSPAELKDLSSRRTEDISLDTSAILQRITSSLGFGHLTDTLIEQLAGELAVFVSDVYDLGIQTGIEWRVVVGAPLESRNSRYEYTG